jgi:hypothetical protein
VIGVLDLDAVPLSPEEPSAGVFIDERADERPSPTSDSRKAFCTPGCHSSFYFKRCIVCENDKPAGSTARRKLCRRPKCEGRESGGDGCRSARSRHR